MKYLLIIILLLPLMGCQEQSAIRYQMITPYRTIVDSNDPNTSFLPDGIVEARGRAANILAEQVATNTKTSMSQIASVQKYSAVLYAGFILVVVGGLIFWGFSRSKWGWVIPSASITGILLLLLLAGSTQQLAQWAPWVLTGLVGLSFFIIIWRTVWPKKGYQAERDKYKRLYNSNITTQYIGQYLDKEKK